MKQSKKHDQPPIVWSFMDFPYSMDSRMTIHPSRTARVRQETLKPRCIVIGTVGPAWRSSVCPSLSFIFDLRCPSFVLLVPVYQGPDFRFRSKIWMMRSISSCRPNSVKSVVRGFQEAKKRAAPTARGSIGFYQSHQNHEEKTLHYKHTRQQVRSL